jgi:uncharacterized membrane protein HdeD (DUF308 family)
MTQGNRFNSIQISGLIISVLGLIFAGFPTLVGVFAVKIITLMFMVLGIFAMTFAIFVKSKLSILVSSIIVMVGIYSFIYPQYVLFLIGISCVVSGLNGIFLTFSKFKVSSERTMISSIILLLLGVFAMVNSKAALTTVVLILGIMIVIFGIVLFFVGTTLPKRKNKSFFYTFSNSAPSEPQVPKSRIIVNIDDDDVEEIDFKEL